MPSPYKSPARMIYLSGVAVGIATGIFLCLLYHDVEKLAYGGDWIQDYYAAESASALRQLQLQDQERQLNERQDRLELKYKSPC